MANRKLNQELRISRMIESVDALIAARCAPLPDDWLEMSLVRMQNDNVPSGYMPIRYKSRDEFFKLPDKWAVWHYTIEGRQIFRAAGGETLRLLPCLNDRPGWIEALAAIARDHLGGWVGEGYDRTAAGAAAKASAARAKELGATA